MTPQTPERAAAERIGAAIFKHLDAHGTFTPQFHAEVAAKVIAHRGFISTVFAELDNDPKRIGQGNEEQLRQQQVNRFEDQDWILERYRELTDEAAWWLAVLRDMGSPYAASLTDRDERNADADDARLSQERRDFAATENQPRWAS